MIKAEVYTKEGFVMTPNGKEYTNLDFALKAYNLSKEVFMERLETGCTLREAFNGIDYPCGLRFDNDGKLHDGSGGTFSTLEEMCKFHQADVEWFNKLYKVTHNLEFSLKQPEGSKSDEYIRKLQARKELLRKEKLEGKKKAQEAQKAKAAYHARVMKAKQVYKEYNHYLKEFDLMPIEIAWQVLRLGEFIESYTSLKYDEKRLYEKAENSIKYGETNVLGTEDIPNHALVKDILKDFVCKRTIKKPSMAAMAPAARKALNAFIIEDYGNQLRKKVSSKGAKEEAVEDEEDNKQRAPALDRAEIMRKVQEIHEQEMIEMRKKEAEWRKQEQQKIEERKAIQKAKLRAKFDALKLKANEDKAAESKKDVAVTSDTAQEFNLDMLYQDDIEYTDEEREAADIISVYACDWKYNALTTS